MALEKIIWIVIQVVVGYNLILPFLLFLVWKLFVKKPRAIHKELSSGQSDYAIIVTAYEQTDNLPAVVASIKKQKYENYIIYIVADKCDISNLNFDNEKVL